MRQVRAVNGSSRLPLRQVFWCTNSECGKNTRKLAQERRSAPPKDGPVEDARAEMRKSPTRFFFFFFFFFTSCVMAPRVCSWRPVRFPKNRETRRRWSQGIAAAPGRDDPPSKSLPASTRAAQGPRWFADGDTFTAARQKRAVCTSEVEGQAEWMAAPFMWQNAGPRMMVGQSKG